MKAMAGSIGQVWQLFWLRPAPRCSRRWIAAGRSLKVAKMESSPRLTSPESLVRQFVSTATSLCFQLQGGLPEGAALDPIHVILSGCLSGRIRQGGEINRVRYERHGFGVFLRDARRPPEIPGTVDLDIKFGELDLAAAYIFHAGCITRFARSLNLPEPAELEVERACIELVHAGVLAGTSTPSIDPSSRWSHEHRLEMERVRIELVHAGLLDDTPTPAIDRWSDGHWSFDPHLGDLVGPQGRDLTAKRNALRLAVESLGPPRHKTAFEWDEVGIVNEPFEDDSTVYH